MTESLKLVLSIVVRNWTVYRKNLIANISPTVSDPSLIMLSLGLGLGPYLKELDGRSYLAFLAPGLLASTALFTSFFEASYGFFVRMTFENVFKAMLTTPIGPREIVLGELTWNFLKGAFMAAGVGIFLSFFGLTPGFFSLFFAAIIGGLIALPLASIGLLAACKVKNIDQFQSVYSFLIAPLYFISGTFFPLAGLPNSLQNLIQLSPFAHGVSLMQLLFWQEISFRAVVWHGGILLLYSVALGGLAMGAVRRKLIS